MQIGKLVPKTLKNRLVFALMLSSLIPLLLMGVVSYYSIFSLVQNRVERGIQQNLQVERIALENTLNNLDYVSKQLANNEFGSKYEEFIISDAFGKYTIRNHITELTQVILFSNPVVGTMFYYIPEEKQYIWHYFPIRKDVLPDSFPELSKGNYVRFFAPHQSMSNIVQNPVLSVLRQVRFNRPDDSMYVYLETNTDIFQNTLQNVQYGFQVKHLLVNDQGLVVYNEAEGSSGEVVTPVPYKAENWSDQYAPFYEKSKNGWQLIALVRKQDMSAEITQWVFRYMLVGTFSLLVSFVLAALLWRMIYRPINKFKNEIRMISNSQFSGETKRVGLMEFDDLLKRFSEMKVRILELLDEVEKKEIKKRQLEVEKLMHQINPHFLHNTLNTIQWIAMMNGQNEIVTLVKVFTRVLNYNLGKEGSIVTVKDEIQALRDYLQLQQIRYNFAFRVNIDVNEQAMDCPLPRFLLQPLVENALYHGFSDDNGKVDVTADIDSEAHLVIRVADNGQGMDPEKIARLMQPQKEGPGAKSGIGIGLNYVNNLIQVYYGEAYRLQVYSQPGMGTEMLVRIPMRLKEANP